MNKRKIIISAAMIALGGFVASCTKDFEEINTNPNAPLIEQAAPDLLLTNAIESLTDRVQNIGLGHEIGSGWIQHMAKVQYTDEDRYQPRTGEINNAWTSLYAASGQDATTLIKIGEASGNTNYQGVGIVLKVYAISVLTDLFGDIPYSEAFKGDPADGGILSPTYDTQESIYTDLLAKLEEANDLLDHDGEEIAGDILYNNDIDQWKKFANSLRMRLLMRISERKPDLAGAELTKMLADSEKYPIFESFEDNAQLNYLGSAPNNNPINENRKTRDDHRVSKTIIDIMLDLGDVRVFAFANPASGTKVFEGIPNGLTSAKAAAYNENGLANTSKMGDYFTAAEAPGVLMSYSELAFILAEAAKRGLIAGGDAEAEQYYYEGIIASYQEYNEYIQHIFDTQTSYGQFSGWSLGYLLIGEDLDNSDGAAEDESELEWYLNESAAVYDPANGLEQIYLQKYIAMFGQGLQAWFEWRRTEFPDLTPAEDAINTAGIPVRLTYPLDEATRNPSNLETAVGRQGADNLNTRVWWDVD
jgi:hypothetical protein